MGNLNLDYSVPTDHVMPGTPHPQPTSAAGGGGTAPGTPPPQPTPPPDDGKPFSPANDPDSAIDRANAGSDRGPKMYVDDTNSERTGVIRYSSPHSGDSPNAPYIRAQSINDHMNLSPKESMDSADGQVDAHAKADIANYGAPSLATQDEADTVMHARANYEEAQARAADPDTIARNETDAANAGIAYNRGKIVKGRKM